MTASNDTDLYYDPFDTEIDKDPHPVWRRLREEAPLYYNEKHDFFALSRFDDVDKALMNWDVYRSGRGSTLEIIKANITLPPGIILMEDPPIHDLHRGLLSRVFTPRKMNALEPKVREFCAAQSRSARWIRGIRLHRRPGGTDAHANDWHAARHPRAGPRSHPRPTGRGHAHRRGGGVRTPDGRRLHGSRRRDVRRVRRLASAAPLGRPDDRVAECRVRG